MNVRKMIFCIASLFLLQSPLIEARENGVVIIPGFPYEVIEHEQNFTCNGRWPGDRTCSWKWNQPGGGALLPPKYWKVRITSGSSKKAKILSKGVSGDKMFLDVQVNEGDVFNPGKHTTSFEIKYYVFPF